MPDNADYAWLEQFLAASATWSEDNLATARSMLENQRRAVEEAHPRDVRGRRSLQEVVDLLEAAIRRHEGS